MFSAMGADSTSDREPHKTTAGNDASNIDPFGAPEAQVSALYPLSRLTSLSTQFTNVVLIATFTGGVQAAILSFMNDLLSVDSIQAQLFHPDPNDPKIAKYTYYSGGVMLGLVAIALNIGVAAIATVGAALACPRPAALPKTHSPEFDRFCSTLDARLVLCMVVTFTAFLLSGISLMALSIEFDPSFTCFLAVLFFGGIVIAAYQPTVRFSEGWWDNLCGKEPWERFFHVCSLLVSAVAFMVSWARPRVPPFWYAASVYGTTTLFHIIAVLYEASTKKGQDIWTGEENSAPPKQVPITPEAHTHTPVSPDDQTLVTSEKRTPVTSEDQPQVAPQRNGQLDHRQNSTGPKTTPPPRRLAVVCASILSVSWFGCALITAVMKWRSTTFNRQVDDLLRYVITGLAVLEGVVLAGMAIWKGRLVLKSRKLSRGRDRPRGSE